MTRMDSTRIGKNFGYMARTLRNLEDESLFVNAARAVLEHHFDCHDYCGAWCRRKNESTEQKKVSRKYYRSKEQSEHLYMVLSDKILCAICQS